MNAVGQSQSLPGGRRPRLWFGEAHAGPSAISAADRFGLREGFRDVRWRITRRVPSLGLFLFA